MALTNPSPYAHDVTVLNEQQLDSVRAFMQGAVYCWVKNRKDEPFAVRDLVGGENKDWTGTPLQALYDNHVRQGKPDEDAYKAAAIDLGWIVKAILKNDLRTFENAKDGLVNSYRWKP